MMSLSCLVVIATVLAVADADYDSKFCRKYLGEIDDSSAQGLKPNFYDNFTVFIEMKTEINQTVDYITEYYSQHVEQAYFNVRVANAQVQFWVDAKTDEIMTGPTAKTKCTDAKLDKSVFAADLGVTTDAKGDVELNSPEVALGWDKKYQIESKYLRESTSRGMKTVSWIICAFNPETQITTVTTWQIADPYVTILPVVTVGEPVKPVLPISAEIRGVNKTDPNNTVEFAVRYDFTFYDNISPDGRIFQIPTSMLCAAKPSAQVPLPKAPNYFRFRGEQIVIPNTNTQNPGAADIVFTVETYMQELKLFVQDFISKPSSTQTSEPYQRIIDDYSTGISFNIDVTRGSCNAIPIDPNNVDAVPIAGGHVIMRNSQQFFDLNSDQYQYMGIHTMRGIQCNAWSVYFTDKQALYTWYFANPDWLKSQGYANWTNALPVALEVVQDDSYTLFNIYEFDTQDFMPIPDTSLCFDPNSTLNIELFLSAPFIQVSSLSVASFRRAFYATLIVQTRLNSVVRISHLDIQPAANSQTIVRFKLFDLRPLNIQGTVPSAQPGVSNNEIYNQLNAAINAGTFSVAVFDPTNINAPNKTFTAIPYSLGLYEDGKFVTIPQTALTNPSLRSRSIGHRSMRAANPTGVSNSPPPESTGYSGGSMAGIGIGMLVLGLALGGISDVGYRRVRTRQSRADIDMKQLEHESQT